MNDRAAYILDLLREKGPLSDETLAGLVIGDQGQATEVAPLTNELEVNGLIKPSEFAQGRWQITDAGRRIRGDNPRC